MTPIEEGGLIPRSDHISREVRNAVFGQVEVLAQHYVNGAQARYGDLIAFHSPVQQSPDMRAAAAGRGVNLWVIQRYRNQYGAIQTDAIIGGRMATVMILADGAVHEITRAHSGDMNLLIDGHISTTSLPDKKGKATPLFQGADKLGPTIKISNHDDSVRADQPLLAAALRDAAQTTLQFHHTESIIDPAINGEYADILASNLEGSPRQKYTR